MKELFLVVLMLLPTPVLAAAADCIRINNDLDRLACYDRELGRTPKSVVQQSPASQWKVETETSQLTDDKNVYLQLQSEEVINCGWNQGDRITLVIRCLERSTNLYFATNCHMTSSDYDDSGLVEYRLDSEPARTTRMKASTNSRALGIWSTGKAIRVTKQLFGKSRLIARMRPYGENPFIASFHIAGLADAIKPLREACSW